MAIVVEEKFPSRRLDASSAEVIYHVTGTGADAGSVTDEDAFTAVAGSAPATKFEMPGANIDVRQELVVGTVWEVAAIYSATDPVIYQQSSVRYEFSFQAPQERIYQSLFTRGAYSASGPVDPNMFGGAINVVNEQGEQKVEGVDLPAGSPTNTWIYSPLNATVTDAYQTAVESVMGAVNNTTFKLRAGRTMRLVSVDGGAMFAFGTIARWEIRFAFQFRANRFGINLGDIVVPFVGGHDVLWAYYEDALHDSESEPANNGPIKRPKFIFVEQVFPELNLNVLGI